MTKYALCSLSLIALAGCSSVRTKQLSGTEVVQDNDGHSKLVTYVSPEEYQRMTPEERQRLNATMGASVSVSFPGGKAPSQPISEEEFKKASAK